MLRLSCRHQYYAGISFSGAQMKVPGFPHGVTVRYRMPRDDQEREGVDGARMLRRMYEDR